MSGTVEQSIHEVDFCGQVASADDAVDLINAFWIRSDEDRLLATCLNSATVLAPHRDYALGVRGRAVP